MRVLIIGGTGLISSAIVTGLVANGHQVTTLNRGSSPPIDDRVQTILCDRRDRESFIEAIAGQRRFDVAIDMVAYHPEDAHADVLALGNRVDRMIFCSTVEVYTKPESELPIKIGHPTHPITDYGRAKRECETLLFAAQSAGVFSLTILRPAYTYGEGRPLLYALGDARYPAVIGEGWPVVVPSDGNAAWVACHRDDVATAFVSSVERQCSAGRVYNVAGSTPMTWNEYHRSVARILGRTDLDLLHLPSSYLRDRFAGFADREHIFVHNYWFNCSEAELDLGWKPRISFDDGAERALTWLAHHQFRSQALEPLELELARSWSQSQAR